MEQKLLENYKERRAIYTEFTDSTGKETIGKIAEYRENMRNFALMCVAISAASLASLGLAIPKNTELIILGSCLLIYLTFLCFVHLFGDNRKEIRGILEFRKSLKPLEDSLTAFEGLILEKITREEFDEVEKSYEKYKKTILEHKRDLTRQFDSNNDEIFIMVGVAFGFILVMLGFLLPFLAIYF